MKIVGRRLGCRFIHTSTVAVLAMLLGTFMIVASSQAAASQPSDCSPADPSWPSLYPEVCGAIRDEWLRTGGLHGDLGPPTSPQFETTGQILGDAKPGEGQHFATGSIYSTADTGAHAVFGPVRDKYMESGWENGELGYPTSAVFDTIGGGQAARFEHGTIHWSPLTGVHLVPEAALALWESTGYEQGFLGYPISDLTQAFDGQADVVHFRGGDIYIDGRGASLELPEHVEVPVEPHQFVTGDLPGHESYSYDFDLNRTRYLTLPDDAEAVFDELRRCFDCNFPVFEAPAGFPDQGDVLPLKACNFWKLEDAFCDAPVSMYSNGRTFVRYSALDGHFDGADSTVTFTFYRKGASTWMNVTGFVVDPLVPETASREGAFIAWDTYAQQLGQNLFLEQCHGSPDCS
jgi:hypothetical protein